MSSTAHEDQFTDAPEPVRHPYDTGSILRRNVADLEIALKQQTERAEKAEAELLAVREDNHSMMLEIDLLRNELAKLREQERERCAQLCEWLPVGTGYEGKTFAEAIRGNGLGGKLADGFIPSTFRITEPVPAPAVPASIVPDGDDFNGSTPHLIQCMEALVRLDADGVLVPHGIGRDASKLLSAAANRLRQQAASSVPKEWRKALQEAHDTFQRYADLHRAKGTQDGYEKSKANQKLANKLYALLQSAPTGEPK